MYRRIFIRTAILCALVALSSSPPAYAAEESAVKVQGRIMAVDPDKNTMIVNERVFVWDPRTTVHNEKGFPTRIDRFKEKTDVYIIGDQEGEDKRVLIKKIYLLPKRVEKKDRHLYPFIQ